MTSPLPDPERSNDAEPDNSASLRVNLLRPSTVFVSSMFSRPLGFLALGCLLFGAFIMKPEGLGVSICGLQRVTGLPCPGCGLTRSVASTLQGHPGWAFLYNPLGPPVAVVFVLLSLQALLPNRWRDPMKAWFMRHCKVFFRLAIVWVALLFVYGILRIGLILGGADTWQWWRDSENPPFVEVQPSS